jgi:small GTP-binding protein
MESNLGEIKILPDNIPNSDLSFKVIIIGNSNVGKSCISIRAVKNVFESEHIATVGFELFCYNVSIKEKILKLEIWDTCGSENYRSITTNYYRNSSLAIIVYSIDE